MPSNAPAVKRRAGRGGRRGDRRRRARARRAAAASPRSSPRERGLVLIPPYDDARIIAGQGTLGLEIAEDVPDLAAVLVPIGGGGLSSGVAVAIRALVPDARIIGVEPELAADARDVAGEGRIVALVARSRSEPHDRGRRADAGDRPAQLRAPVAPARRRRHRVRGRDRGRRPAHGRGGAARRRAVGRARTPAMRFRAAEAGLRARRPGRRRRQRRQRRPRALSRVPAGARPARGLAALSRTASLRAIAQIAPNTARSGRSGARRWMPSRDSLHPRRRERRWSDLPDPAQQARREPRPEAAAPARGAASRACTEGRVSPAATRPRCPRRRPPRPRAAPPVGPRARGSRPAPARAAAPRRRSALLVAHPGGHGSASSAAMNTTSPGEPHDPAGELLVGERRRALGPAERRVVRVQRRRRRTGSPAEERVQRQLEEDVQDARPRAEPPRRRVGADDRPPEQERRARNSACSRSWIRRFSSARSNSGEKWLGHRTA